MASNDKVKAEVKAEVGVSNGKTEVALLMQRVFGDRLNGLSEAEVAFVRDSMIANLDKVKAEAKERAAWAEVLDDIAGVIVKHGKTSVVASKGLRLMFDAGGKVNTFNIYTPKGSGATSASGQVKQYGPKSGAGPWKDCDKTYADACKRENIPVNGASAKVKLETRFATRVVPVGQANIEDAEAAIK